MNARRRHAFTLPELVIATVFIAVVLGPLLLYVSRIHELNATVGRQARREAWRTFQDQVVLSGVDPNLAAGLAVGDNPAVPGMAGLPVSAATVDPQPGVPTLVPLTVQSGAGFPEPRLVAGGWQIGRGGEPSPRTPARPPLAPIVMPAPTLSPQSGSTLTIAELEADADASYATLSLTGRANAYVCGILNRPSVRMGGIMEATQRVTAAELAQGVSGYVWAEYPGDPDAGDRAVRLADGRTRWLIQTSEGRLQIYEPSPLAAFNYRLALGAPVLVRGGVEHPVDSALPFDYVAYLAVQDGTTGLRIDFPAATKRAFGSHWDALGIGFQCFFGATAGPFDGALEGFFSSANAALWSDQILVRATAVIPAAAVATAGSWTLLRNKLSLGVPVLTTAADSRGFHAPGEMRFSVGTTGPGAGLGRLSFENGTKLSTGTTLALTVLP